MKGPRWAILIRISDQLFRLHTVRKKDWPEFVMCIFFQSNGGGSDVRTLENQYKGLEIFF